MHWSHRVSAHSLDDRAVTFLSWGEEIPFSYKHTTKISQLSKTQSACITKWLGVKLFTAILVTLTLLPTYHTRAMLTMYKSELVTGEENKQTSTKIMLYSARHYPSSIFCLLSLPLTPRWEATLTAQRFRKLIRHML